jgi:hypothetical protein
VGAAAGDVVDVADVSVRVGVELGGVVTVTGVVVLGVVTTTHAMMPTVTYRCLK